MAPRPGLEPGTCGLTPISRRGVKTANESLVVLATIVSNISRFITRHAPVSSSYWLRTESRQTPIRFKHYAECARALVASPPQKNIGTAPRPRVCLQFSGCQSLGTSLELARDAGDPDSISRTQKQRPFSLLVHVQLIRWLAASALIIAQAKQRFTSNGLFSLSM